VNTQRSKDELAFLPAALEIQETPPLPLARYIGWTIMAFFVIGAAWASVGEVDIVAVAHGKVVPSGRVKVIQPLESGVVKRILVDEGQRVGAGDVLIELDNTASGADTARLEAQKRALELDRARITALLTALSDTEQSEQPSRMIDLIAGGIEGADAMQLRRQGERAAQQLAEVRARLASISERISQRTAERSAIGDRIEQLERTLPLVTERAEALKNLLESNLGSRVQWMEAEEARITQAKQLDIERRNRDAIDAAIRALHQERAANANQMTANFTADLSETEVRLASLSEEIVKARQRTDFRRLRAPVNGVVKQLAIHTVGGVVTPAQRLMEIVPEGTPLEVEAFFRNRDIGFVETGQQTEIKVEAFPFTRYGTINGHIETLSEDAVQDENVGLVYTAQISLDKLTLEVEGKTVRLSPGMAVTVEAKTGKRRLIEFLLSPLLRFSQESARER
jgi:hemolysin D